MGVVGVAGMRAVAGVAGMRAVAGVGGQGGLGRRVGLCGANRPGRWAMHQGMGTGMGTGTGCRAAGPRRGIAAAADMGMDVGVHVGPGCDGAAYKSGEARRFNARVAAAARMFLVEFSNRQWAQPWTGLARAHGLRELAEHGESGADSVMPSQPLDWEGPQRSPAPSCGSHASECCSALVPQRACTCWRG